MTKTPKTVTAPMLSFALLNEPGTANQNTHKINLWVLDAGQFAELAEPRSFHFGDTKTAGLIYEEIFNGRYATEQNIWHASTWAWIAKWMERGLLAEGYMGPNDAKHWERSPSESANPYVAKDRESVQTAEQAAAVLKLPVKP